jgi:hypothetical protein
VEHHVAVSVRCVVPERADERRDECGLGEVRGGAVAIVQRFGGLAVDDRRRWISRPQRESSHEGRHQGMYVDPLYASVVQLTFADKATTSE